jgi:hypothetical protein
VAAGIGDVNVRRFVPRSFAVLLSILVAATCLWAQDADLESAFTNPPSRYGPSCFWWWFGAPYSSADVKSRLNEMKAAGLGGFRIYPVYAFPGAQLPPGTKNQPYLSPGFVQLERTAVEHGRTIGMVPEAFLTSGWPYGGPWIPPELGAGQLKFYSREVTGPIVLNEHIPGDVAAPEKLLAVMAAEASVRDGIDLASTLDLTARVSSANTIEWNVPPGRWLLMTFVGGFTGMKVKRAAPGGEGLVLDHFSREALAVHLRAAGDVQKDALAGALSIGVDSWEVYGADWTPRLPAEFERRRGYDLTPVLPALFLPCGTAGSRIRYDFRRTVSELAVENFFTPLASWAHTNGLKVRSQAHGTPADVIEAYGASDFPEGETYGPEDRLAMHIRDRKFASSAAHLFARNQISAESFTWLRFPMFRVTLEEMKAAADAIYLDGINQVNYHGVPFSPEWAEAPGFYFYASTFVSPGNTWWPYLSHLSTYLRRANFMLQQGHPVADIAVYAPYEDVWSAATGSWSDLAGSIEQHMKDNGSAEMLRGLRSAGYDFDFINARRLADSRVEDGRLAIGSMRYRVVLLPSLTTIDPEALERLRDFCRAGGVVIASDRLPDRSPGSRNAAEEDARVMSAVAELWGAAGIRLNEVGRGRTLLIPPDPARNLSPPRNAVVQAISTIASPDCRFEESDPSIGFVHRREGSTDVYFIANVSTEDKSVRARFHRTPGTVRILDPETGLAPPASWKKIQEETIVTVPLRAWGSAFVILSVAAEQMKSVELMAPSKTTILPLAGPWALTRTGLTAVSIDRLQGWTEFPGWQDFSGAAVYTTTFTVPQSVLSPHDVRVSIDLGEVRDIADVSVNGTSLGVAWKHPYTVDVTRAIRPGINQLEVRVTNLLFNRMLVKEPNLPPPYYRLLDYATTPMPSGLLGPVNLEVR